MLSDHLGKQLSRLTRGGAPAAAAPARRAVAPPAISHRLEGVVARSDHGEYLLWEKGVIESSTEGGRVIRRYLGAFERAARRCEHDDAHPDFVALAAADPGGLVFMDLETTGLHGRPVFLIGLMRYDGHDLVISQLFARDYAEEKAILDRAAALVADATMLVTFNGKAFDVPYLRNRMIYHRLPPTEGGAHFDLLHHSRRRWRDQLPNCRLQTLEQHLCRRLRSGDIPGELIPQRYHDYVRSRDPRLVAPVFHHNRLDLISLAELLAAVVE
jgi:uncharacterized protein YprB with RNaseH-like and TPR domain